MPSSTIPSCLLEDAERESRAEQVAERFDPRALIDGVVSTCAPPARRNRTAIELRGETPGILVADATKLRQMLLNLVGNAAPSGIGADAPV